MSTPCRSIAPNALFPVVVLSLITLLCSCGGSSSTTTTTTTTTTNAYATAYQSAKFNNGTTGNLTVSFPSSCSMTVTGTGVPYQHQTYYLAPVGTGGTVVATTPSGIQLQVIAYAGTGLSTNVSTVSGTFNTCPMKATSTTATSGGPIGLIFSGTVLFDAYEATTTVALGDNASYTFASTACGGTTCTASFLDPCNQHTAGGTSGSTWHFHGVPSCWTSAVDGSSGPSHIIGIALDGYPIYGGYDINGNAVSVSSLDACNGITSATPEFPSGAYHYVLPVGVTTKQSSINCYSGTVNATLAEMMKKLACKMPFLLASGKMRLPDGREVSREEDAVWMKQTMPGMPMGAMPGMQMAGDMPPAAPQPAKGVMRPGEE
jgi:hypothetical protein